MVRLRRPELIVYILVVALGAGLLYWQRERIQNLVTDEPEAEAPAKPGASPEGVDAGGGGNDSPSGQPSPPGQQPGGDEDTGETATTPDGVSVNTPDLPVDVSVCRPRLKLNC